jgi:hypothetical protein
MVLKGFRSFLMLPLSYSALLVPSSLGNETGIVKRSHPKEQVQLMLASECSFGNCALVLPNGG